MNVLEKILEEISKVEKEYVTGHKVLYALGATGMATEISGIIRSHMDEAISEMERIDKEKVTSAEIISRKVGEKTYYSIKYKTVGEDYYNIGYSSYKLDYVIAWLNKYFEFCGEAKVVSDNNGWIPVEERLPNEEEFKEAYCRNKYAAEFVVMIEDATRPTTLYYKNGSWFDEERNYYSVVAWQPLPKPYKEG